MTTVLPPHTPVVYDADTGRPYPMADALADWWTCPDWCDPQHCAGGEVYPYPEATVRMMRTHQTIRYAAVSTNPDLEDGQSEVTLYILQKEDAEDGHQPVERVLEINGQPVDVTPELARNLAAALTALYGSEA